MYHGVLPLLTNGPFVLFYGGEIGEKKPAGRGVFVLILLSTLFQLCLFVIKRVKYRRIESYAQALLISLVENVLNMYGLIVIIVISVISFLYIVIHQSCIENGLFAICEKNSDQLTIPKEIHILYVSTTLCATIPFFQSFPLRWYDQCWKLRHS